MLLQALYNYATERNLLANLPFQRRTVHLLIPLNADGSLRGTGFVPLTTPVVVKEEQKEKPGQVHLLPRYPGEKNNSRAQFLADPVNVVLGLDKKTLDPLPEGELKKVPDAVKQFREFWGWVPDGSDSDARFVTLRSFRENHLDIVRGWVTVRARDSGKGKPEPHARLEDGSWQPLKTANVVGFWIDGNPFVVDNLALPIWRDWQNRFDLRFREEVGFAPESPKRSSESVTPLETVPATTPRRSICLVTGNVGVEVANIHKPEVKLPGTPPKGASFFSCGEPSFCSYGFKGGENASVSIDAVASYVLALENLLGSEDTCVRVLTSRFCFWTEKQTKRVGMKFSTLGTAHPKAVADLLREPFSGIEVPLAQSEQFFSVALSANGGRVVVREWLRIPLAKAIDNLASWFSDLSIAPPPHETKGTPYRIAFLAGCAMKPPSGKPSSQYKQRFDLYVNELYRAAIGGTAPPKKLLEPILAEFRTALLTNTEDKPKYPLSQSRFAIIKLILTRTPTGGFMPQSYLVDTPDPAYNLGRLLMVLSKLQKAAHKNDTSGTVSDGLKGPGVVERYYGEASSAPATTFPTLCKLHHHHLRKLEQKGEQGRSMAAVYRNKIGDILALLRGDPARADGSPEFPRQLPLEAQGRFALGFYQQRTHDRIETNIRRLLRDVKAKLDSEPATAKELLSEAKRVAEKYGYPELIDLVTRSFSPHNT